MVLGPKLRLLNSYTGERLKTFTGGFHTYFYSVVFSSDGKTIANGGNRISRKPVHLWDVQTGRFMGSFTDGTSLTTAINFSPDGRTLAAEPETVAYGYGRFAPANNS